MKKYIDPKMSVTMFAMEDICTASGEVTTTPTDATAEKLAGKAAEVSYSVLEFK